VYGDADPVFTYQIISGELLDADEFTGNLERTQGENTGKNYEIKIGTLSAGGNYHLVYEPAEFSVTARPVTVTAATQSKTYGDPDPTLTYAITTGTLAEGDSFEGALSRDAGEEAGTYAIAQGTLALNANYDIKYMGAS